MSDPKKCVLCQLPIELGTETVSVAGGFFPRDDPDFFAMDENVLTECYAHLDCFIAAAKAIASDSPN